MGKWTLSQETVGHTDNRKQKPNSRRDRAPSFPSGAQPWDAGLIPQASHTLPQVVWEQRFLHSHFMEWEQRHRSSSQACLQNHHQAPHYRIHFKLIPKAGTEKWGSSVDGTLSPCPSQNVLPAVASPPTPGRRLPRVI